jgi:hypothetical protein
MALGVAGLLLALAAAPAHIAGQSGLEAPCMTAHAGDQAECLLAVATTRAVQERVGIALWGGNPVPGTASTLGMRIGASPRYSASGSLSLVPATLPPLLDRDASRGERVLVPGLSLNGAVGVLPGWSPLPTVGGVLSMDVLAGLSVAGLPGAFEESAVVGWQAGVRVGALRESFTMPGVSLTGTYGRSGSVTYGDPSGETTDGYARGAISDLNGTLAVSRRISALRLTGGLAVDRYATDARVGYRSSDPDRAGPVDQRGSVTTRSRSWFANASWTTLIFHGAAELGWQDTADPIGLPPDVRYNPSSWWAGVAFRISI